MFDADYYGEDEGLEKPTWNEEDELEGEFSRRYGHRVDYGR